MMRRLYLGWLLLSVLATTWTSSIVAQEEAQKPREIVIRDNFEQGMDRWEPTDAAKWRIHQLTPENAVLELLGKSNYQPPHRSPHSIVWLKDVVVEDFVITVDVQTTQTSRGHRDMCVFFGEQDAANFYYVHLGEVTDDHSNQIFRVKDAPRIKISDKTTKGTPWKDETWHKIKVVRKVESRLIEVYFDDMETPQLTATDKSFGAGRVGLGSFDDMGYFDNFELRGTAAADAKLPAENEGANVSDQPDPASLEFFRWSGPVNVPDPVAISLDNQGKAYVTQTQRRKIQDLDIRENRDWIPHDVGFQTVDDKREFYRERLAPEHSKSNTRRVPDLNKDGLHDYRDLTVISEKIHRVEDTTGDGVADTIELFAEGFNTEVTGIAAGVLWHGGDVFATIAPDVWRLRDTTGDGQADKREVIATGFGLHIAYAGHDMHGLKVGPDGKIYWSIGDKGISVISQEGKSFQFPNQGGVLRCNPDGSDFEVFAHGLRNVQEFAFDAFGEIFAVDNDADMKGEKERFVYIAPGIDAGWRCNFQYRGSDFNPWMDEGLWETRHAGQPAYVTPPLRYGHDGPAGFAFNPGTALNPAYRDYFFSTGAPNGNQYAFHVERVGASYEIQNYHQFGKGVPLVGINFGPDGGLYGVDWGGGYPLNQKGAIWKIDDPTFAKTPEREEVSRLLASGLADHNTASLAKLLGHADQRIRLEAQFELVRRGNLEILTQHTGSNQSAMTRVHAIWGLGQLARKNRSEAQETLASLLKDSDPEIQAQAIKTLADAPQVDGNLFLPLLNSDSARVQMHAALALSRHPTPEAMDAIIELIEANNGGDLYLRHAGVMALSAQSDVESLATHASEEVRLTAVVAMRRQRAKEVATFLHDQSPTVVAEAARAIHDDLSIPEALPHLAALLSDVSFDDPKILRRAINANFRLGTPEAAERLVTFASQTERAKEMRLVAIRSLAQWLKPEPLDLVDGRNRTSEFVSRKLDLSTLEDALQAWLVEPTPEIQTAAMNLAKRLKLPLDSEALLAVIESETLDIHLRVEALTTISAQNPDLIPKASESAFRSPNGELRVAAVRAIAPHDSSDAAAKALKLMDDKPVLRWRQEIVAIMGTLGDPRTDAWLAMNIQQLIERPDTELALDLYEAGLVRGEENSQIASILEKLEQSFLNPETRDSRAAFQITLRGGDAANGQKIFTTNVTAQCVRCHRLGNEGSDVGPNLAGIASHKDRQYLLRSIVEPSADIEAKYRTRMLLLETGQVVQGVVKSESDKKIVLTDAQGKDIEVDINLIEDEADQNISIMPEMIKQLSKREIRDLVAFLATLKEKPQGK